MSLSLPLLSVFPLPPSFTKLLSTTCFGSSTVVLPSSSSKKVTDFMEISLSRSLSEEEPVLLFLERCKCLQFLDRDLLLFCIVGLNISLLTQSATFCLNFSCFVYFKFFCILSISFLMNSLFSSKSSSSL